MSSKARRRLLDTARELFYAEGIHAVGVDRIAAVSGVAKSTLYEHFRTKEQLVAEYLAEWSLRWRAVLEQELATLDLGPVERALAVFDLLGDAVADPTFRGCPFINAAAEYPAEPVVEAPVDDHRRWVADLFTALAAEARVPEPDIVGDALAQLHDGATVSAHLDGRLDAPARARRAATLILPRRARRTGGGSSLLVEHVHCFVRWTSARASSPPPGCPAGGRRPARPGGWPRRPPPPGRRGRGRTG